MLTAANIEGLSYAQIEARAAASGFKISHGTANVYMNGKHGRPNRRHLAALAAVFPSLKLADLLRAADLPPDYGPYEPPEEASALSRPERDALDTIIKAMARSRADLPTKSEVALAGQKRPRSDRPKRSKDDS